MDCLNPIESAEAESPYEVLLRAVLLIPVSHYLLGLWLIVVVFLYNFLEIHILQDLFTGLRGQKVVLTFNPSSQLYRDVVSKCRVLHGRQIFITSDGGTLALDWVKNVEVKNLAYQLNDAVEQDDKKPIVIIIPGLTSDSNSADLNNSNVYVKHLAFSMAKRGWNVVSDCFYNAGWTEDVRKVIDHVHSQFPEAPLFLVGTSIGANILVKYLAEDGTNAPIVGAAAICSPWDLLICDRFINRKLAQRFYNKALAIGLKDYAHLHEDVLSRLSNWEGVKKSRSVRDFDDCATRVLGNYETVDTYYRRSSSSSFVGSVTTPLLCISSLDDPVCTSEAIPWDECSQGMSVD
ncbi:UNVERIFIED_CONTAM: hypothetical protein Scaly_0711600 [Sesamum calycinum]|uniref:Serine aminopeptidase S33 domain-containing protein n=1 Tax=Sesamum calycinum TaxID=2727403 RepID=A0AAW2R7A1_9LAMI